MRNRRAGSSSSSSFESLTKDTKEQSMKLTQLEFSAKHMRPRRAAVATKQTKAKARATPSPQSAAATQSTAASRVQAAESATAKPAVRRSSKVPHVTRPDLCGAAHV